MPDHRDGEGARALLFERLVDENPRMRMELRPLRTHDAAGLRASVMKRVEMLLNTRATRPRPADGPLTVLDYGLPDYSAMYTRDPTAQKELARNIRITIAAFEPRLILDEVLVEPVSSTDRSLSVTMYGRVRSEHTTEPVAFSIPLNGEGTAEELT